MLLHGALGAGLIASVRTLPRPVELPAFQIELTPPPRAPKPPRPTLRSSNAAPATAPSILHAPASAPAAQAAALDTRGLWRAPFADGRWPRPPRRLKLGCLGDLAQMPREQREACFDKAGAAAVQGPTYPAGSVEGQGEFAKAARRKEAFREYRSTVNGEFPGLRCAFGRACEPAGR